MLVGRQDGHLACKELGVFVDVALTVLVGRQDGHLACKELGVFVDGDIFTGTLHVL